MLKVGLTGGIGSGKSTVAVRLAERGAWMIDSDRIAREVVEPGSPGLDAVVEAFGPDIRSTDGGLDRGALAARVFDDPDARRRLNTIVHPLVGARAAELVRAAPRDAIVVHDIPLLVEEQMAASFPLVVVVHAEREVRIRRLVEQRGMPPADVRARIAAQASDEQRRAVADVWLDNSGTRQDTLAAADRLWDRRLVPFEDNLRHQRRAARPSRPVLVPSDPTWEQQAWRVVARIAAVAAQRAHRIDHIGSTAVPGLDAQDVLDVQVVVPDLDQARRLGDELIGVGLVRLTDRFSDQDRHGRSWDKVFAANADPDRAVDCHIRPVDSPAWRDALLWRDWLRAHPGAAGDYSAVPGALTQAEQWAARTGWAVAART